MSGFRLGSFEVLERIASGGMGDIWSGVHAIQDVPVAIKVIRNGGEDIHFKRAFRHEVRSVAQLDHPGIITVFDIGEVPEEVTDASAGALESGSPYLVMEYVERGSLESQEFPLPWARTKEIIMATLAGLAHAHARGITHRDLKPGNILLAEEQTAYPIRLADFGIAFSYRESRSEEAEGRVVGTPTYMAPEQFMGEWRDFGPWTDLYALGCVAYQLASGRVPFEQHDLMQLGSAHIQQRHPKLDCAPDYPDGFDNWVARLLEKEPARRYRRCAEAADALKSLTTPAPARGGRISKVVASIDRSRANARIPVPGGNTVAESSWIAPPVLQRPFRLIGAGLRLFGLRGVPMVDRDSERDTMGKMFGRVVEQGLPGLVVLEGPAGSGKTRLAEWLYERTHELNLAECLKAEHDRSRGRESGLSHMLAAAWSCLGMSGAQLQSRVTTILVSAGIKSRAMRRAVTEFLAPASLGDDFRPGMFHEFRSRSARFSCLFEALRRVYEGRPLVVWLDDVHWGNESLHFLHFVLGRSPADPIPMMAVLTARDDLLVESPEASRLLRDLCMEEAAECVHLEPLTDTDSRLLVGSLLHLQGDLAERVATRSGGNPLYATQLVGDWVARGILEAGMSGFVLSGSGQPEVPDDVHAVWVRRLERVLDESTGAVVRSRTQPVKRIEMQVALELAAALDGRVDLDEWTSVCSLAGISDPNPVLESMLASRLARLSSDGWSFSHSMLRDSIERIAREKRRWAAHNRLCADMLEQRRPVPHWGDSDRIGRHRFEAAQFDAAVNPLLRGARERLRLEQYSAALELLALCDRALEGLGVPNDEPRRLEARVLQAEIHCTRRELNEAAELANHVRALAGSADTERFSGAALVVLARVHQHQGRLHTALNDFVEAQRILRITGPKNSLAACLSEQAYTMLDLDLLDQAWEAFNEVQDLYEEIGQIVSWAENQLGLARVALRQGNPEHASTLGRRVRAFAEREDLNRIEAAAWLVLSEVHMAQGQWADAERSLDKSIQLVEQLGLARQAIYPRSLRILLWLESGFVGKAKVEFEQLRASPEIEVSLTDRSLMHCLGLAIAIDGPGPDFQSSFDQTAASLTETEVVMPSVLRCLLVAAERATALEFPERASQVSRLRSAHSTRLQTGDDGTQRS